MLLAKAYWEFKNKNVQKMNDIYMHYMFYIFNMFYMYMYYVKINHNSN